MAELNFRWISEYQGPNSVAPRPIVLGALNATLPLELSLTKDAILTLWEHSKISPVPIINKKPVKEGDGLLILAQEGSYWAKAFLNDFRGSVLDSGAQWKGDDVLVWLGFHDPYLSRAAFHLALRSMLGIMNGSFDQVAFGVELDRLWQACRRLHPDFQASIIMEEAQRRDLPFTQAWGLRRYWRFGEASLSRVLFESSSIDDGHFGASISSVKSTSKMVLTKLGLPTPAFEMVNNEVEIAAVIEKIGFPCVTKPLDRGGGKGVSAGHSTIDAAVRGFQAARAVSKLPIMIEAHLSGEDHRLLVVDGVLVAAIRREPPQIIGNGVSTIQQLVDRANINKDATRPKKSNYSRPIVLDASAQMHLSSLELDPASIIEEGKTIRLRSNGNLSTGGVCFDVTSKVHPHIRTMAETLAQTLNLQMMGADYITSDISCSPEELGGGFVEFNTTPGLDALIAANWPVEKAGALCLPQKLGRIPKELIIVTQASFEDFCRAAARFPWPPNVGWAAKDEARLAGAPLLVSHSHGWDGPLTVLEHRSVYCAVFVGSDQHIQSLGAPADRFTHATIVGEVSEITRATVESVSDTVEVVDANVHAEVIIASVLELLTNLGKRNRE